MSHNEINSQQTQAIKAKIERIKDFCKRNSSSPDIIKNINELEELLLGVIDEEAVNLSAQVSLYPLRQSSLSQPISEALKIFKKSALEVVPGSMSSLVYGEAAQLWSCMEKVFSTAALHGELVMVLTISNACPRG